MDRDGHGIGANSAIAERSAGIRLNVMPDDDRTGDELRSEYDFSKLKGGVRGKYVQRYRAGTNLLKVDPDV